MSGQDMEPYSLRGAASLPQSTPAPTSLLELLVLVASKLECTGKRFAWRRQ